MASSVRSSSVVVGPAFGFDGECDPAGDVVPCIGDDAPEDDWDFRPPPPPEIITGSTEMMFMHSRTFSS